MANKKNDWTNPLARQTPGESEPAPAQEPAQEKPWPSDNSDLDEGRIISNGVGIKEGELRALGVMAKKYGITRNALLRLAVRKLILAERAGTADIQSVEPEIKTPRRKPIYPS